MCGVTHEAAGAQDFSTHLQSNVYINETREFFGPTMRWFPNSGIFRLSVLTSLYSAWKSGAMAGSNMTGEGRLLGGVLLVGKDDTGIVYKYEESQPGDFVNMEELLRAAETIKQ